MTDDDRRVPPPGPPNGRGEGAQEAGTVARRGDPSGEQAQPPLRFELLGPVRAWRGEWEIPLGPPQQRAVLTALLLHGGAALTRDQLVAALWGDLAPPGADATLRTYVSRLRRALAGAGVREVITSVGGGYALPTPTWSSDLGEFERLSRAAREAGTAGDPETEAALLRAALAHWKGVPLAGVRAEYAEHERECSRSGSPRWSSCSTGGPRFRHLARACRGRSGWLRWRCAR